MYFVNADISGLKQVNLTNLLGSLAAGYENHPFQFISGSIPEVFSFPGTASISYHAKRGTDLPNDLIMGFKVKKVAPYVYDVPCTFGQGSWYDILFTLEDRCDFC